MKNIVLIGMPGAGKSTVGVILAKQLSMDFIDTDLLLQHRHRRCLQEILDTFGYLKLREFEEAEILRLHADNAVVATGGSAVYSERAVSHLKKQGPAVYLAHEVGELLRRIDNFDRRGIAKAPGQAFQALFEERQVLYLRYADIIVDCAGKTHEAVAREIGRRA